MLRRRKKNFERFFFAEEKMDQGKGFHPGLRVVEGALLFFFFQSLPGKTRRYLAASSGTFYFYFLLWLGANDLPGIRWSEWQGGSEFSIFFELRMLRSFEWIVFTVFIFSYPSDWFIETLTLTTTFQLFFSKKQKSWGEADALKSLSYIYTASNWDRSMGRFTLHFSTDEFTTTRQKEKRTSRHIVNEL